MKTKKREREISHQSKLMPINCLCSAANGSKSRIPCRPLPAEHSRLWTTEQTRKAKQHRANSLDTPAGHPDTASPIPRTVPRRSPIRTAVLDEDLESCHLPFRQVKVPVILSQDSIANLESADRETNSAQCPLNALNLRPRAFSAGTYCWGCGYTHVAAAYL